MTRRRAPLAAVLLVAMACAAGMRGRAERSDTPDGSEATLDWRELVETPPGCRPDWDRNLEELTCPFVRLRYPEVRLAAGPGASRPVNGWIEDVLWSALDDERRHASLDHAGRAFLATAREMENEHAGRGSWYLDVAVTVLRDAEGVLSLEARMYTYQGENHADEARLLRSFSSETGAPLRLADLVGERGAARVRELAEAEFRRQKGLPAAMPLADTRFEFPKGEFEVPENVALGPAGLVLHFNPYEIASWSEGATELLVPWAAIAPYVTELKEAPHGRSDRPR